MAELTRKQLINLKRVARKDYKYKGYNFYIEVIFDTNEDMMITEDFVKSIVIMPHCIYLNASSFLVTDGQLLERIKEAEQCTFEFIDCLIKKQSYHDYLIKSFGFEYLNQ